MSLPRRSQSALEYMMTYGWAILVIVIVAAVLYSLGIFSPSSSLSTTITGFSNLGTVNAVCLGGTSFTISMGDSTSYPINITQINLTSSSGKTTYSPNILIQPNSIQTVTVPSSSLCTSGARYSVSAVISYLEPGQVFQGPYTSTGTVSGTAASPPSSATSYEPLTIANTQNQGTPSPFQQMINVTSSSPGWGDISSSPFGQNVEFFSATGQILDSWLENYTSTHAIWWVKLTSSIPVGSKQTIYIGFAPTSTNLFNTNDIGEAPQIPCGSTPTSSCSNYAEYDDGANVFIDYWNFAGTTMPSSFLLTECGSGGGYNVNNSITLDNCQFIFSQQIISYSVIADISVPILSDSSYAIYFGLSTELAYMAGDGIPEGAYMVAFPDSTSGGLDLFYQTNYGGVSVGSIPYTFSDDKVYSIDWVSTGKEGAYINYQKEISGNDTALKIGDYYLFVGPDSPGASVSFQWLRTRAYPPNGVMPSVSFGSVS